jgi:hypothetical protein
MVRLLMADYWAAVHGRGNEVVETAKLGKTGTGTGDVNVNLLMLCCTGLG